MKVYKYIKKRMLRTLKRFFYMWKYFQGPDAYCLNWIKSLEQKYYAFKKKTVWSGLLILKATEGRQID